MLHSFKANTFGACTFIPVWGARVAIAVKKYIIRMKSYITQKVSLVSKI